MDNFEEFFGAFDAAETATPEETPSAEEITQTEEAAEAEPEQEPSEESAAEEGAEEKPGSETGTEPPAEEGEPEEQSFTVRIGEEDRQYSLEEMTELARKGAGYDALQTQLEEIQQDRDQLQTRVNEQQEIMDTLSLIAEKSGKSAGELMKQMFINFRKSAGLSEEAAALELENAQLKKQMNASKPAEQKTKTADETQARAKREFAEFRQLHPGVALTEAMVAKLKPDIRKGMSLSNAYQKMLNDQKAAELAEQERKAKAKEQNDKNRAASPGSQQDSGGRREKSKFEDFFSQFK